MRVHRKTFAEVDVCPTCEGIFFDPGEALAELGPEAEVSFLVEEGRARRLRPSILKCPAHAAPVGEGAFRSAAPAQAPTFVVYAVGTEERSVEVDVCPRCGGFWLDAGEGEALLAKVDAEVDVVDAYRKEHGTGLLYQFGQRALTGAAEFGRASARHEARAAARRELRMERSMLGRLFLR